MTLSHSNVFNFADLCTIMQYPLPFGIAAYFLFFVKSTTNTVGIFRSPHQHDQVGLPCFYPFLKSMIHFVFTIYFSRPATMILYILFFFNI